MNDRDAAVATLIQLGYTYRGGMLWVPPIGKAPNWSLLDQKQHQIDCLTQELAEAREFKMAQAINVHCVARDQKAMIEEARHIVTRFRAVLGGLRYQDNAEGEYFKNRNMAMSIRCDAFILKATEIKQQGYRPGDVHPSAEK